MPEFPMATPHPARVHERMRSLVGHHPHWRRASYAGGLYCTAHFRTCSICGSIHPSDMAALLRAGHSRLEPESTAKPHKRILITPNPIAGRSVQIGSTPGPVFDRGRWPQTLRDRLKDPAAQPQHPSIGERLACHFEHPSFEPAPPFIAQPFFLEHASAEQWEEIALLAYGESQ
jgi:hypothetical protein